MSKLTKEQLEKYLNFINKCIEKNFDITSEERELLGKIELERSSDKNTKDLIDSLMWEQSNANRHEKIDKYLGRK